MVVMMDYQSSSPRFDGHHCSRFLEQETCCAVRGTAEKQHVFADIVLPAPVGAK